MVVKKAIIIKVFENLSDKIIKLLCSQPMYVLYLTHFCHPG